MIYSISANVFAKKLGPMFGRTVKVDVEATSEDEARKLGYESIEEYCNALHKHHQGDFEFNNFAVKEQSQKNSDN